MVSVWCVAARGVRSPCVSVQQCSSSGVASRISNQFCHGGPVSVLCSMLKALYSLQRWIKFYLLFPPSVLLLLSCSAARFPSFPRDSVVPPHYQDPSIVRPTGRPGLQHTRNAVQARKGQIWVFSGFLAQCAVI